MRYVHIIISERYLGCQRHFGCKDMCLGSNKKILGTILILFLKFHISSFLRLGLPLSYLKKENIWNFKNIIKIVPKIFLFDSKHISLHPECLWHPRYLSETIICTYLISKRFYRDKREATLLFWDPVSPKRRFSTGPFLDIDMTFCN